MNPAESYEMQGNREDREGTVLTASKTYLPRPSARQPQPSADQNICILSNFSCCLTNNSKKAALKCLFILQPLRLCTVAQTADFRGLPQYQSRMRTVDNVITVVLPRNPCKKREYSQSLLKNWSLDREKLAETDNRVQPYSNRISVKVVLMCAA